MMRMRTLRRNVQSGSQIPKEKMHTLLEKAENYRNNHQELLEDDDERSLNTMKIEDEFDVDSFLEEYYDTMKEIRKQEREFKEAQPPSLHVKLNFFKPEELDYDRITRETESPEENEEPSVFTSVIAKHKRIGRCCGGGNKRLKTKMIITIFDAVQLNKMLADDVPRLKNCKVKCIVKFRDVNKEKEANTGYAYCDQSGSTAWYHRIILKGFTVDELLASYIALEVIGMNRDESIPLARVVLTEKTESTTKKSTKTINIKKEKKYKEWKEALNEPGKSFSIITHLQHYTVKGFGKSITSLLVKEARLFKSGDMDLIGFENMKKRMSCIKKK